MRLDLSEARVQVNNNFPHLNITVFVFMFICFDNNVWHGDNSDGNCALILLIESLANLYINHFTVIVSALTARVHNQPIEIIYSFICN